MTLFEGSNLKRELLQTTAPTFFGDLNALFIEHFVLHICRLTDSAQTMGRKNLTVKFLMEHTDWSGAAGTLAKLKPIGNSIHRFRERILPSRKWFIAHLDLSAVRQDQPLGAATDAEWKQFWLDLQDFLELMFRHHVDPNLSVRLRQTGRPVVRVKRDAISSYISSPLLRIKFLRPLLKSFGPLPCTIMSHDQRGRHH